MRFIFQDQPDSEQESDESIEEGSLNQPLAEQLDNLAGIFPDQITPTLHPSFSTRHRTIQPQMRLLAPYVSNLPLHPEISKRLIT